MRPFDLLVVSPHPDDAVFSLGGLLALRGRARERVALVTVFSRGPDAAVRSREDAAAAASVGAELVELGLSDAAERRPGVRRFPALTHGDSALVEQVRAALEPLADGADTLAPLGVAAHADHQVAFRACAALPGRVAFYEDVPYALCPHQSALRLRSVAGAPRSRPTLGERIALARWWLDRPVLGELAPAALVPLAAVLASAHAPPPPERPLQLVEERFDVSSAMDAKLAAIAHYATQWPRFYRTLPELRAALAGHSRRLGSPFIVERLFRRS